MAVNFYTEDTDFLPAGRIKTAAWLRDTVKSEGYRPREISLIFCSQPYLLNMNRYYLGHDYPTDVITFDYSNREGRREVSGDIFIDPVRVREQAAVWGSTPGEELMRVMVHGVLHLCGYGDKTIKQEKIMRSLEDKYLAEYIRVNSKYPSQKL